MTVNTYTVDVASGGEHYRRLIRATSYEIVSDAATTSVTFYNDTGARKVVAEFVISKQHSFSVWED